MNYPVATMFGRIAGVYDLLNHILSLGIDKIWRRQLAAHISTGTLLDIAAGTLDVALALHKAHPDATILALDFCPPMLLKGLSKLDSESRRAAILPIAGDALALPLPDASIDGITIAFGIRNITPRQKAFSEMLRVLKPGGSACILEFGSASERIWGGIYNFYLANILPQIARLAAKDKSAYEYLARTVREFPTAQKLENEMRDSGFTKTGFRKMTGGIICLHWGERSRENGIRQ